MTRVARINGLDVTITGGPIKVARMEQEWYEDLENPDGMMKELAGEGVDIFTFWQRYPDVAPKYSHYREEDDIAVLPISTYEEWWTKQISSRTRGAIRKSAKQGLVVKEAEYTDEFVRGMTSIFNETPMRQGRPFWHYGKDFETVKRQFSKYLFRETLIGAYWEDELIGFMMIGLAGPYAVTGQIISKIGHRDKGTNNSLIAKAVEVCAERKIPYLIYLRWTKGSLTEFKRRNGFEKVAMPRYYVPLTATGRIALRVGLHKGVVNLLPETTVSRLKHFRTKAYRAAYSLKYGSARLADGDA